MGGRGTSIKNVAAIVRRNALVWARSQIGTSRYAISATLGDWSSNSYKCNAFVIQAFNHNLITPVIGVKRNPWTLGMTEVQYRAIDFYEGRVPGFIRVAVPVPGDIVSNGRHVGIVSGKNTTISASSKTNTVVENGWGFGSKKYRYYRYVGQ